MIRYIFSVSLALIIAILCGFFGSEYIFKNFDGFSPLTIGQWRATPMAGTSEADPYARAHRLRQNDLALGRAEGIMFYSWHDNEGKILNSNCNYKIIGHLPSFRLFTLYAINSDQTPITGPAPYPFQLNSNAVIFEEKGDINITVSSHAQPGNWFYVAKGNNFGLVLTLYDTPVASDTGLINPAMPKIERIKDLPCD